MKGRLAAGERLNVSSVGRMFHPNVVHFLGATGRHSDRDHWSVEEVDAIAAIDGVELLFVGRLNLSQALGVIGYFTHAKYVRAIDRVAAACRSHGERWGAVTPSPDYAALLIEKGCTPVSAVSDVKLISAGLIAMRASFARVW